MMLLMLLSLMMIPEKPLLTTTLLRTMLLSALTLIMIPCSATAIRGTGAVETHPVVLNQVVVAAVARRTIDFDPFVGKIANDKSSYRAVAGSNLNPVDATGGCGINAVQFNDWIAGVSRLSRGIENHGVEQVVRPPEATRILQYSSPLSGIASGST